ncbi:hypothetical protein [Nostoc sp. 'Peltigera membranacea cyanobiont' 232]|uniref:hypothetical protein n=1 Tax=Nostoc sp. 'Peltigera membranacea cyanobiont' 232 TaxID=2014531 RepID=UPI001673E385|nr:hypothetical protein [Nostoc sp. 'Peltigera membranacea cyanobiont' 232]
MIVRELIEKLQQFPADSVIDIVDVDYKEFAIVSFNPRGNTAIIVIGEKVDDEPEEEGS